MKYVASLALVLFSVGLAHAEWPFVDAPAKEAAWPFKSCDCAPCTCPPDDCHCAKCALGCKKSGAANAASEQVAFVGLDPFQTTPTTVETPQQATPTGYHIEYRQGACSGGSCPLVPVMVRDVDGQSFATGACNGGTCATGNCGSGGCSSGSCGSQASSGGCGRSGPIRRFIGRLRGR